MPAAARTHGEDEQLAAPAGDEVMVLGALSSDGAVKDCVGVNRATGMWDTLRGERRYNSGKK